MIYKTIKDLYKEPIVKFTKNSPKEILQYAVGGLLYTPATNKNIARKITHSEIPYLTSIALCLEDAIGSGQVTEAEACVKNTLEEIKKASNVCIDSEELPLIFIRVREPKQITRLYKKCGDLLELITGFLIPKFDKDNMQEYIESFHKVSEKLTSPIYILPIIESSKAIYQQKRIDNLLQIREGLEQIKDSVLNVRVGAADFSNIYGIRRKINECIWDVRVVSDCLADILNMFSRDFVVSGGVWEYFGSEEDSDKTSPWLQGFKNELALDKLNGMIGKTCIHPTQLKYVQENLIVSREEYEDALQILSIDVSKCGVIKGVRQGKMNEVRTHSNWAKKIINLANIYGVKE